ncbi:S26 family signal peptidase [Haloarcula pelagica]|uniref:S26 family signal peptidase n=1 Tax=Haloarcula pelagica TaxID=3033389 RepID=UPI0024C3EA74|nr:S26 family signal peptidase [Halomicroarcula sp. YJ-61-S]
MSIQEGITNAAETVLVLVVLALLVGQLLGQPVLLGFVRTGSMDPALEPDDGFVAIPSALTGPPEPGDVIVFEAEEIQDGGLTTHRVVGTTEDGYITRGDANAITDQTAGEPPVGDHQVVAEVLQINGWVVAIPGLGAGIGVVGDAVQGAQLTLARWSGTELFLGTEGLLTIVAAAAFGYLGFDSVYGTRDERDRDTDRSRSQGLDPRILVAACALVLAVGLTVPTVVQGGTTETEIISSSFDSERADIVPAGESTTRTRQLRNPSYLPNVVYLVPGDGVGVSDRVVRVPPQSRREVTVTLHAPADTGSYQRLLTTHRYVAVLPASLLTELHGEHPWLPAIGTLGAIVVPFYLIGSSIIGRSRLRRRRRERSQPTDGLVGRFR